MPASRRCAGLPTCPPARAAVEFAARLGDRRTGTAVVADVVQRRIASSHGIAAEASHVTGRGGGVVRLIANDIVAGVRSAPEADFLELCRRSTLLPLPLLNPLIALPNGRKISPDALFVDAGVIHESNGREPHADEDRFESMQSRHDALTAAGLTVLHNSGRQVRDESTRVQREVETCYQRLADRGLPPGVRLLRAGPPP